MIHTPNTFFMQVLFKGVTTVTPELWDRRWELLKADGGEFVTCDRPVAVTLRDPEMRERMEPDFRDPSHTDLTFPLNRNLLLFGSVHENASSGVGGSAVSVTTREVASLNSRTISMANRFVCWSGGELLWLTRMKTVGNAHQLLEAVLSGRPGMSAE